MELSYFERKCLLTNTYKGGMSQCLKVLKQEILLSVENFYIPCMGAQEQTKTTRFDKINILCIDGITDQGRISFCGRGKRPGGRWCQEFTGLCRIV